MNSLAEKIVMVIIFFGLTGGVVLKGGDVAVAQQAASSENTAGQSCKVTKGPNKGKTGTYSDDGWCEGDWGGTECGDSNDKCEDLASGSINLGVVAVYDGNLSRVLKSGDFGKSLPSVETKIVGAVRLSRADPYYIEVTDRNCKKWKSILAKQVKSAHVLSMPAIECDGESYPVLSIHLHELKDGDTDSPGEDGPAVVAVSRLSHFVQLPRLVIGGAISDGDWSNCVDRYLDCQIDCQGDGGGVFGSVQACLSHCDAVFDACTFDPF